MPSLGLFLRFPYGPPGKAPGGRCLREGLTPAEWNRRAGVRLALRDALFPASPREASRFENQFSFGHNCPLPTITLQSGIEPGPWARRGRVGRPPVWDVHPATTCGGFLSFTKERGKKIRNKRQSLVCLGAFIPQRKDRCAHCPALGSYDRVSAEPQPGASCGHNGGQPLRAWVSGSDVEQSVCGLCWAKLKTVRSFPGALTESEPTNSVSAKNVLRS